jgi:hypothetical protein
VTQTLTTHYTISAGTGTSGADQIAFVTGSPDYTPSDGAIVTCDFTGYLRMKVRFTDDQLSREMFNYRLFRMGLSMTGLAGT